MGVGSFLKVIDARPQPKVFRPSVPGVNFYKFYIGREPTSGHLSSLLHFTIRDSQADRHYREALCLGRSPLPDQTPHSFGKMVDLVGFYQVFGGTGEHGSLFVHGS